MRIGIVGSENETHSQLMKAVLEKRGVEPVIIDTMPYPEQIPFSFSDWNVKYKGLSLDDIRSFYVRSVFISIPVMELRDRYVAVEDWYTEYMAERERHSFLASWLRSLPLQGKLVVNPVESFDTHYLKLYQLMLEKKAGIPIPKTIVTNAPEDILKLAKEKTKFIFKPVAGGAKCTELNEKYLLPEKMETLKNAPVMFQEKIEGKNLRVYALEDKILSSVIIESDDIDYRGHEKDIRKVNLAPEVANMCLTAMRLCGMKFSGIDLKIKPSNEVILLECNPSPMFFGIQKATGDPIAEMLAEYLIEGALQNSS